MKSPTASKSSIRRRVTADRTAASMAPASRRRKPSMSRARRRGTLNHLTCNMFTVEARVQHLHGSIVGDYKTKGNLLRLATRLWARARGPAEG